METAIVEMIAERRNQQSWQGLLYIMGTREFPEFKPLFIGKCDKEGLKIENNTNMKKVETNTNFFARWGDSPAYHIGDLSHVLFDEKPNAPKQRWAEVLFESYDPPVLKETVYLYIAPWYKQSVSLQGNIEVTLDELKKELSSEAFSTLL